MPAGAGADRGDDRLVCFTILTRTRRGRTKAAAIRVLTALLDPDAFPAAETAALYAAR